MGIPGMNINISKKSLILILSVAVIILGGAAAFAPNSPFKLKFPSISFNFSSKNIISSTSSVPSAPAVPVYKPVIDYEQAVTGAVEKASPAVVSIIISKDLPVIEQCPYNPFSDLPPEFQQYFGDQFQLSQPCESNGRTQRQEIGGGSGFIISKDGLVATNKHVVFDAAASYTVLTNDGKKYDAEILARHPSLDIAILKIKASAGGLPILIMGDSDSIKLGQTAIAIGNALGEFRNTVSVGVISGLSRTVTASGGGATETIEGVIQTDAAINPGNSGGPLLNLKGEVIGINTAMVSGAQNIGFALPINQVKKSIESVKATGEISVPYLGVRYMLVTPDLAEKEKLPVESGVILIGGNEGPAVVFGSPAQKAGLQAEDIITELNGTKIDKDHSLPYLIQQYNVGDKITLKILRNGKEMTLEATLEERPKQ